MTDLGCRGKVERAGEKYSPALFIAVWCQYSMFCIKL